MFREHTEIVIFISECQEDPTRNQVKITNEAVTVTSLKKQPTDERRAISTDPQLEPKATTRVREMLTNAVNRRESCASPTTTSHLKELNRTRAVKNCRWGRCGMLPVSSMLTNQCRSQPINRNIKKMELRPWLESQGQVRQRRRRHQQKATMQNL